MAQVIRTSFLGLVAGGLLFSIAKVQAAQTITVNSDADSGGICPGATCTLRQAILTAFPGDTIDFAASINTINLTSAELVINKSLTITGPGAKLLTIQRSTASGTPDFRVFNITAGDVIFFGLTIANGAASAYGGGIYNSSGTLTVSECVISGNATSRGGGIYNADGGTVNIALSTISGNLTTSDGGGIYNSSGGTVTIRNSTISENRVESEASYIKGGGIYNSSGGTVTLTNSTISGNAVDCSGGVASCAQASGIYNDAGTVTLTSCTVAYNSRSGIANNGDGTVYARNTIIARNHVAGAAFPPDFYGTLTSQGYNLIGDTHACCTGITGDTTGNQLNVDPVLGPLQDNGGPTFTHALLSGSPALDKGDASGLSTDQRGYPRPANNPTIPNATGGDGSDIGAFERQEVSIATSSNLSTRSRVLTGDNIMIGGFIITGTVPKRVVLRALGPSTVSAGVPAGSVLNDPVLELRGDSGALLSSNDNWKESPQRSQIEGTVFQPSDDREAVILTTLPLAGYTAVVKGKNGGTGIGVVEIYDLDPNNGSTLANVSSRAFVDTGNDVLIGGFTLGGNNGSPEIVVRALGHSLSGAGVTNYLVDPTLELRDANGGLVGSDDNWKDDAIQADYLRAVRLQPAYDAEAALAVSLPPGAYTAIVAGKNGGTGVGLVEIYNLQ